MSLTTIEQVRTHLGRITVGGGEIRNQPIRLIAGEYSYLPHGHLASASEAVKAILDAVPHSEALTLSGEPASLAHAHLVPETVVCAADSSLGCVYQENVDYVIDYTAGVISRVDDGGIPNGGEVVAWYLFYHRYDKGVDYDIDYEQGRLKRITAGGIESGQELLIDYALGSTDFSDDEIEQCIAEAEADIRHVIDPIHRESTDPALQTAATCIALSLLCRNAAAMTMTSIAAAGRSSSPWLELSASYRETATRLLVWFRVTAPGLATPRLA
jgi:hypothetical protein